MMKNIYRAISALSLICPLIAGASTPITASYLRVVDIGIAAPDTCEAMTTDSAGNLYFGTYTDIVGFGLWTFKKYDPYGAAVWTQSLSVPLGGTLSKMSVDASGNVYAVGTLAPDNASIGVVKLSKTGNVLLMKEYSSSSVNTQKPIAITSTATGAIRVALSVKYLGTLAAAIASFSTNGGISIVIDSSMGGPVLGDFNAAGDFLGWGFDGNQNSSWWLFNSSMVLVKKETTPNTGVTSYQYRTAFDASGNPYVALNAQTAATKLFALRSYTPAGSLNWVTPTSDGLVSSLCATDSANIYALLSRTAGFYMSRVDSTGVKWATASETGLVHADGSGVVLQQGGNTIMAKEAFDRFNSAGSIDWTISAPMPSGVSAIKPIGVRVLNGQVFMAGTGNMPTTSSDAMLWKFCPGLAVASVSTANPLVASGAPFVGAVNLNVNAVSPTVIGFGSSNPAIVSVPSSVTVPAGVKTAGFNAYAAIVDVPTYVTLTAKYNGVARTLTVQVQPSAFTNFSVSQTSVKAGNLDPATVTIAGPAGIAGRVITLSSSDSTIGKVPATVTIPPGQNFATFSVQTFAGKTGPVTITAKSGSVTLTKNLTVTL